MEEPTLEGLLVCKKKLYQLGLDILPKLRANAALHRLHIELFPDSRAFSYT